MLSKFNIDALRQPDGSYRQASMALIKGAVGCGHTAHLQTERGIVAFRPYTLKAEWMASRLDRDGNPRIPGEKVGQNWLVEFYPADHAADNRNEVQLYTADPKAAARFAFANLNGSPHSFEAGDFVEVYSNQAMRDGCVLATRGFEVLVEYEMPAGTSALVLFMPLGNELGSPVRNYSYNRVPQCWIDAIRRSGQTHWIGMGQRSRTRIPFPGEEASC